MAVIAPSEVLGCSNAKLRFWLLYNYVKTAVFQLQFIVYDVSTPANQASPVQVYPGSGRATVNVSASCPTGDYIDFDGGYVASFTMPLVGAGLYQIRWFWKRTSSDNEGTYKHEFWVT